MASEKDIQKNNLEAELATIKSEIEVEAGKLSEILANKSAVEQSIKDLDAAKLVFDRLKIDTELQFTDERKSISDAKSRSDDEIGLNKTILKNIKDDIKNAIKELSWLNDRIINAETAIVSIGNEKTRLDIEVANLLVLVAHKEDEEKKLQKAIDSRQAIEIAIENKKVGVDEEVRKSSIELEKILSEVSVKITERDKVQNELKSYTDQLYTAMNDYHIVRTRLETRFKEHYPELELPLMA